MTVRIAQARDVDAAMAVWRAATVARRPDRPMPPELEARSRGCFAKPDAFAVVAEDEGRMLGVGLGMQGRADDGAGPPVSGLCHVAMIFVAPDRWGAGIGGRIVDAVLDDARAHGYIRAQLWTHDDNVRAQRLYEHRGFAPSGRRKLDDLGEPIRHYERVL